MEDIEGISWVTVALLNDDDDWFNITRAYEDDDDWDIKIATKVLIDAVDRLAGRVGNAKTGVLVNVGDFFHADSSANTTTKGTPVDVDTRIGKNFKLAGLTAVILR